MNFIPTERIEHQIFFIRGRKVMIDSYLALLYKVPTKSLIQSIKRNLSRFPEDFMFQLSNEEFLILRSQIVTSRHGGRRYNPYVFTDMGIAMLSSILKSECAIQVNIQIMRIFTRLREMLTTHKDLRKKIEEMEKKYDYQFKRVFDAIKEIIEQEQKQYSLKKDYKIGFLK